MSAHRTDQVRLVLWRRKGARRRNLFQRSDEFRNQFLSRKNFGQRLDWPFNLLMRAKKPKNWLDGVPAFLNEHPNDHPLLFDVLRNILAGDRESFQKSEQRVGCSPVRKLLRRFDPWRVLALRFGEPLHNLLDLFG